MERRLLTAQRLEQLLTAPSVEACAQLLSEWGYAPVHDEPSLQAALSAQREAVFADVSRFMPEAEVLDVFRLKYDYHNIKTLLKAPQDAERLLIDAGTVPAETMRKKHAENGGWDFLPADMAAAADEAQRVLAETGSARSSDCILDRAYFARLEKLAADSHIPYLQDYVRAMIDAANDQGGKLSEVYEVQSGGDTIGYAFKVTASGSQGNIVMIVGVDTDLTVTGVSIVKASETAGIGSKVMDNEATSAGTGALDQFVGKSGAGTLVVKQNIDAVTGATVSTKGVTKGVNAALAAAEAMN